MKLVYPAELYPREDGKGFVVDVIDLPGCITQGNCLADAIEMGIDAASGWILSEWEDGNTVPVATQMQSMNPRERDGFISALILDMDEYASKYGKKSIRKNITIPAWLNTFGEKHGLNFSRVLQEALLNISLSNDFPGIKTNHVGNDKDMADMIEER